MSQSHSLLAIFLGVCLFCGGPAVMQGQEKDKSNPGPSTEYDARALRIESHPGQWLLVRGREGVVVGDLGALRRPVDLASVVAPSENAVREARVFKSAYKRGGLTLGLGIAAFGIGTGVGRMDDLDPAISTTTSVASVAGVLLMAYGAVYLNRASRALARSIWWYNRDLAR